jgi:hypothetical protein
MTKWEYNAVEIGRREWKDPKGKSKGYVDWGIEFTDGTRIVGLTEVLNYYASNGWELVNLVAESSNQVTYAFGASCYRAIFKRQVQ